MRLQTTKSLQAHWRNVHVTGTISCSFYLFFVFFLLLIFSWRKSEDEDYNFDVEDFLLRVIFHNLYNFGSYVSYCAPYQNCPDDCVKCPESNYSSLAQLVCIRIFIQRFFTQVYKKCFCFFNVQVRRNCSQLITKCVFNGESFPCCDYFLPIQTTLGRCFLLNSIQLTER